MVMNFSLFLFVCKITVSPWFLKDSFACVIVLLGIFSFSVWIYHLILFWSEKVSDETSYSLMAVLLHMMFIFHLLSSKCSLSLNFPNLITMCVVWPFMLVAQWATPAIPVRWDQSRFLWKWPTMLREVGVHLGFYLGEIVGLVWPSGFIAMLAWRRGNAGWFSLCFLTHLSHPLSYVTNDKQKNVLQSHAPCLHFYNGILPMNCWSPSERAWN